MSLTVAFVNKTNYIKVLESLFETEYNISKEIVSQNLNYFNNLIKDDIGIYIEFPYVDKHYRDSYYSYYSTKHQRYSRDSIRLSFFTEIVDNDNFRNIDKINCLQKSFLGYITIRPTRSNIFGRSILSPQIYKKHNFICCLVKTNALVNGVKLDVHGFPYCAQDGETLSCAETTILNVNEYFGTKYSDYSPTLPSQIIKILSQRSFERLIPSNGLNTEDISFVLKEFGLSTKVYDKDEYNSEKSHSVSFKEIINTYVDSGIPIIAALRNKQIGHAIIIIGREEVNDRTICQKIKGMFSPTFLSEYIQNYVIMDDNLPPYQLVSFDNPTNDSIYYNDDSFKDCKIESVIVPLYKKVYVDAVMVHELVRSILLEKKLVDSINAEITRIFLTSSRSFKSELCLNKEFRNDDVKNLIISKRMPKFIWLVEFYSGYEQLKDNNVDTLIALDPTEPDTFENHILFILKKNKYIIYNNSSKIYEQWVVDSVNINTFVNNLKGTHCKWKS